MGYRLRRNFVAGLLVFVPFALTFVLLRLVFDKLSSFGRPYVEWLEVQLRETANRISAPAPLADTKNFVANFLEALSEVIGKDLFLDVISVVFIVVLIYLLGWLTTKVLGRRLIDQFDRLAARIPLVKTVYGGSKQLLLSFQKKPGHEVQRVVLLPFPTRTPARSAWSRGPSPTPPPAANSPPSTCRPRPSRPAAIWRSSPSTSSS